MVIKIYRVFTFSYTVFFARPDAHRYRHVLKVTSICKRWIFLGEGRTGLSVVLNLRSQYEQICISLFINLDHADLNMCDDIFQTDRKVTKFMKIPISYFWQNMIDRSEVYNCFRKYGTRICLPLKLARSIQLYISCKFGIKMVLICKSVLDIFPSKIYEK